MNFKLHANDTTVYETKEFLQKICDFFGASFYTRERHNKKANKTFTSYNVMRHNQQSLKKVYDYYHKYPFKGSKYLNFMDWASVVEMPKPLTKEMKEKCIEIRKNFNSTRHIFSWEHLNDWKLY